MSNRKLGDKINRGFMIVVIVLGAIYIGRAIGGIINHNRNDFDASQFVVYPETQDDLAETANALGIDSALVDSTVNDAYVNGFFKDQQ